MCLVGNNRQVSGLYGSGVPDFLLKNLEMGFLEIIIRKIRVILENSDVENLLVVV